MIDILSLSQDEIKDLLKTIDASGSANYRSPQIYRWLHKSQVLSFDEMTNLPAQLRETLKKHFFIMSIDVEEKLVSKKKDTEKYLYRLNDGNTIETVFMKHDYGNSLCISSQVGCKMGCTFCASGLAGFVRNLAPSEMLLQVYETERLGKTIDSIVVMGVGEPLDNFDNVVTFLRTLKSTDGREMSLRRVSISTCGLTDKIHELVKLKLGVTLSVSLHAVTDEERSAIMPINKKHNLAELLESCRAFWALSKRRISFEYALINGINDSAAHATKLAELLKRAKIQPASCHVNLIPINEVDETHYKKSANANDFLKTLEKAGINATIRRTMGEDINAACGQLRIKKGIAKQT